MLPERLLRVEPFTVFFNFIGLIGNGHWRHALAKAASTSWPDVLPTLLKVQQLRFSGNREFEKTAQESKSDMTKLNEELASIRKNFSCARRSCKRLKVSCPPRTTSSCLFRPTKRRCSGSWRHWSLACKPCDDISCAKGRLPCTLCSDF